MKFENWRFCVVANITEYHTAEDGACYRGTKPFTAGTKVYLYRDYWDIEKKYITVIGQNRFGRYALECIPTDCLENIRAQRVFKPTVLKIMNYLEKVDGCDWWDRTSADRKGTKKFVLNRNNKKAR